MKIAIIAHDISRDAGTQRAVGNLANSLAEKHQVSIISICGKPGDKSAFPLNPEIEILNLNISLNGNFIQKLSRRISIFFRLKEVLAQNKFDVVFAARRVICFTLAFFPGIYKKVACEHFNYDQAPLLNKIVRRLLYPRLDAVVLLTHHDAVHYDFLPERKRFVIPNTLSFVCNEPSSCEKKRIIALGRLTPQKGFDYLLKAAVKLKREVPDWHIDIFGTGGDELMLKELAKKLQVDDFVSFHPPTKEVTKELCSSGMYVMSSRYEGLPMVLLEAQECGLPIVSFDCPEGPSEVVHDGEDGFLVPLADTNALAEKIITLAKNQEMRKEFGRNAKINCQQFSPEKVGEMWMDLIHKLTVNKDK